MVREEFNKKFLTDTDETGRHVVKSFRTGKVYYVEVIGDGRGGDWGSYNPGTGVIEQKKGYDKYSGSIRESDSLITPENGFTPDRIHNLEIGESPYGYIDLLDSTYADRKV